MKKIGILLLSITFVTTAFAQTDADREEARRIILGERRSTSSYPKSGNDRDVYAGGDRTVYGNNSRRHPSSYGSVREQRIHEINRAYDAKISAVRWNRNLSRSEKSRAIRRLESERASRIRQVNRSYANDRRFGDDDDCDDDDRYKRNNGRRNGWYKNNRYSYYGK